MQVHVGGNSNSSGTRYEEGRLDQLQECRHATIYVLDIEVRDEEDPSPVSEAFIRETRRDIRIAFGSEKSVTRFMVL